MKLQVCIIVFGFFLSQSFLSNISKGQDVPIQWGEIPRSDLEMKSYPQDTNASVLILCDYGETHFNDEINLVFNRHERVKILTPKGYEFGQYAIGIYTKDETERIYNIKGATYSLDAQGQVIKTELAEKDIFKEEVKENHAVYKFTLPALNPGCVFEVRYTIESESFFSIKDWIFQHSEPVRWSEYRLKYPKTFAYAAITRGYEPWAINDVHDEKQRFFSGRARSFFGQDIMDCTAFRLAVQNIPALRDEPYITAIGDYLNKVDVQLSGYAFVGGEKQVLNNWSALTKELLENKYFGETIDDTRLVRKQAEAITAGLHSPEEKMKALYDWVAKSIVWSGEQRVFADQEVNDILESKKGNNAEITFLLLSLLKSVGIQGDPVILSTRSNGKIQDLYPIISQFNYVLARVAIGSTYYFLDATDPLRPMELLPSKVLNVKGLVIKKAGFEWTYLTSSMRYSNEALALLTLHEDGSLSGSLEESFSEYASLFARRDLLEQKDLDIAKNSFNAEQAGITIDSVAIEARDSINVPLKIKAQVSSSTYAQSSGDLIYMNPHILHRLRENPFKTKVRKFPIDFSYQRSNTAVIKLALPDGFEVKEPLYGLSLSVGRDLAIYSRTVDIDSHQVQMIIKFNIQTTEIKPKYYDELRNFYGRIVSAESEQLVLARIKKPILQDAAIPKPGQKSRKQGKK